jgi:hypothetical protein
MMADGELQEHLCLASRSLSNPEALCLVNLAALRGCHTAV